MLGCFAKKWLRGASLCFVFFPLGASGTADSKPAKPQNIPVIDAEAGPCSVLMTVTDLRGKPVYAATIRVHISHGFLGLRKTDLEIGTNVDGKAKFVGLPEESDEVLYFHAIKGRQKGTAIYLPARNCDANHFVVLSRP